MTGVFVGRTQEPQTLALYIRSTLLVPKQELHMWAAIAQATGTQPGRRQWPGVTWSFKDDALIDMEATWHPGNASLHVAFLRMERLHLVSMRDSWLESSDAVHADGGTGGDHSRSPRNADSGVTSPSTQARALASVSLWPAGSALAAAASLSESWEVRADHAPQ